MDNRYMKRCSALLRNVKQNHHGIPFPSQQDAEYQEQQERSRVGMHVGKLEPWYCIEANYIEAANGCSAESSQAKKTKKHIDITWPSNFRMQIQPRELEAGLYTCVTWPVHSSPKGTPLECSIEGEPMDPMHMQWNRERGQQWLSPHLREVLGTSRLPECRGWRR